MVLAATAVPSFLALVRSLHSMAAAASTATTTTATSTTDAVSSIRSRKAHNHTHTSSGSHGAGFEEDRTSLVMKNLSHAVTEQQIRDMVVRRAAPDTRRSRCGTSLQ